jgi:hypothetical protein
MMATFETIIAAGIYWWLAIHFETYWFLVPGAVGAWLFLLRSGPSVKRGVTWFTGWESQVSKKDWSKPESLSESDRRLLRLISAACVAIGALMGFAGAYLLAAQFLIAIKALGGFLGGFAMGWVVSSVAVAIGSVIAAATIAPSIAVIAKNSRLDTAAVTMSRIGMLTVTGAGAGVGAGALIGAGAIPAFGALAGVGWAALLGSIARSVSGLSAVAMPLAAALVALVVGVMAGEPLMAVISAAGVAIPTVLGSAVGIFLVGLSIRVAATLLHLRVGFLALPRNFRRLMFCTAPTQPPELVPGLIESQSRFTYAHMRNSYRDQTELLGRMFFFILRVIWFLLGWGYRFALKSTCWLWWPLARLGDEPKKAIDDPELYCQEVMGSDIKRWFRRVAWVNIAVFAIINAAHFWHRDSTIFGQPTPTILVMFLLFAVNAGVPPWQWTGVLRSATPLVIRYWTQHASIKLRYYANENVAPELAESGRAPFFWIGKLSQVGTVFTVLYWLGAAGHLVLLANTQSCWITPRPNVQSWVKWIYGDFAPPLPSCSTAAQQVFVVQIS